MSDSGSILTVLGPLAEPVAGTVLPHEHVMVDFIGAEKTGPHRYEREAVIRRMEPFVREAADADISLIFECTPMYLARDPVVLRDLSNRTGVALVTNTGQYKEPYLPRRTFERTAEQIAEEWIAEFEGGIGGTGIRPGFIKTAVHPEPLVGVQRTVTRAAALTSRATGMTIATHTGVAVAANDVLDILEDAGIAPERWIFVHAQNEPDLEAMIGIARRGAWIELDGLRPETAEDHFLRLSRLLDAGFEDQVLLSHDSGWYRVGEPDGGEIHGYTYLVSTFVPFLRERGLDEELITRILARNPLEAYRIA